MTYINDCRWAHVTCRRTTKNESISLDMKVTQAIWHHKDRWSIAFTVFQIVIFFCFIAFRCTVQKCATILPEFNLAKKCLCMTSFVRSYIMISFCTILFRYNRVSTRRKDEKVRQHGGAGVFLSLLFIYEAMRPCFKLEKIDRRTDRQMTEIFLLCRSCHWHWVEKKIHDWHKNTCVIESIVHIKPASLCFHLYSIKLSPNPFDVRPQRQKTEGGGGSKQARSLLFLPREHQHSRARHYQCEW